MISVWHNVKGKTLITGFHGIGMVGFIATDYMVRKLSPKVIGWAYREDFPAVVLFNGEEMEFPIAFYEKDGLIFLRFGVIAEREILNEFAEELVKWAVNAGIKEVIVVGGLSSRGKRGIYGVSNEYGKKLMKKLKVKPFPQELQVFGPMAALLIYGNMYGLPVTALLSVSETARPDLEAARRVVNLLSKYFKLKLDTSDLKREAEKLEKRIEELRQIKKDEMAERMFV